MLRPLAALALIVAFASADIGFPGDPIRRGDPYAKWIFTDKNYPYEDLYIPSGCNTDASATQCALVSFVSSCR